MWQEDVVPKEWLIVNLFKKSDKEELGNYTGISVP